MPGTRLDTNYRLLPPQSTAVARAAPAWLNAKLNVTTAYYILDGKAATAAQLKQLKRQEVASVSFLEGKKATALYGKNVKNGMVIITTKAGRSRQD
ncbi:hypothetical protein [Spirosoma fluminis]